MARKVLDDEEEDEFLNPPPKPRFGFASGCAIGIPGTFFATVSTIIWLTANDSGSRIYGAIFSIITVAGVGLALKFMWPQRRREFLLGLLIPIAMFLLLFGWCALSV